MVGELICAFLGTVSFAIIYRANRRHCILCGVNGFVTWLVYSIVISSGVSSVTASFIACFCLTVIARFLSVQRKAPATVFLVTGIFVLVPGAGLYYTIYNAFLNRPDEASFHCMMTLKTALAIAFGIVMAYILPQKMFVLKKEKRKINEG